MEHAFAAQTMPSDIFFSSAPFASLPSSSCSDCLVQGADGAGGGSEHVSRSGIPSGIKPSLTFSLSVSDRLDQSAAAPPNLTGSIGNKRFPTSTPTHAALTAGCGVLLGGVGSEEM